MRQILNVSIGGTAQQLAQALTAARTMLNAWVSDVGNTVYRKLRWWLSGAASIGLVQRGVAALREDDRRSIERETQAISTGIDAQLRRSIEEWQKLSRVSESAISLMIDRFHELRRPAQTFRDYLAETVEALLRMENPMQRIVESAKRLGVVLSPEQLRSLRESIGGAPGSTMGAMGTFLRFFGQSINEVLLRAPEGFIVGLRNLRELILRPFRGAAESAEAAASMEQRLAILSEVRRADARKRAEEELKQSQELGEAFIDRLEAEKQLHLQAKQWSAAIRIIDQQIAALKDVFELTRERAAQLRVEADLIKLINERAQVLSQVREDEARKQKEQQQELERAAQVQERIRRRQERVADIEFQMQQHREARASAMAPSLEMLAWPFRFMGRSWLSPAAPFARQMLWLQQAIPVAWAMGGRQAAQPLLNRYEAIREMLQHAEFLPQDQTMRALLREQEKAREALERVAQAAKAGRLAVEVELDE